MLDKLQCSIDETHAGSCVGSTLVLDGDSITANTGENSNVIIVDRYGDQGLDSMQGRSFYRYINVGVGGHTCQNRVDAYPTSVRLWLNKPGSKYNVASIQCGINDYNLGTTNATTVYNRILAWVVLAIADGFTPIVWTVENNSITSEAFRNALNGFITGGAVANGYTVADIGADANMGCNGCNANTTYFRDGVHPTIVGNGIYGVSYLKPTLQSLGWN